MTNILLGINCNCFTNRYTEPEEWTKITADLGINYVQFCIDLLDPYYPWEIQKRICDSTINACERHGITIKNNFGGHHSHQHYLGHPDEEVRRESELWFRRAIDQTSYLGGEGFGTCFAIMSARDNVDPQRREMILHDAVRAYHRIAEYGAEKGLKYIYFEPTSTPRESCSTITETRKMLEQCNEMALPMKLCLDIGHRDLGSRQLEDADPCSWIRNLGKYAPVIHVQQTSSGASNHWPFTHEYNEQGIIRGSDVIKAIYDSGAKETLLALEISVKAFFPKEQGFLESMEQSVHYWKQALEGLNEKL